MNDDLQNQPFTRNAINNSLPQQIHSEGTEQLIDIFADEHLE